MNKNLIRKYNVPGPRYTSYPTVPYWDSEVPSVELWKTEVKKSFAISNSTEGISLYIHLPFCESLCTYCGCNTRITINHKVEDPYIGTVLKEWKIYLDIFGDVPKIKEIHLGGGTPTFFSPSNLERLVSGILNTSEKFENPAFSFEAHPNSTSDDHLKTLYNLGFRRMSLGIQDFDPQVQRIVNRIQSFETVKRVTDNARAIGFNSINFDLIYGLPLQTKEGMTETIRLVNQLRPERIAFYSYAHVPWVKPGQRMFTELDLPSDEVKRALYETGKEMFEAAGYIEIGMDHFALPHDDLNKAAATGTLHRNFMGYTPEYTRLSVGLGVSSISDTWTAFAQNIKKVEDYKKAISEGELPIFKGHFLNTEDLIIRRHILNLMCRLHTDIVIEADHEALDENLSRLKELEDDGLVKVTPNSITVTPEGKPFIRNICMALDARLLRKQPQSQIFSKTI